MKEPRLRCSSQVTRCAVCGPDSGAGSAGRPGSTPVEGLYRPRHRVLIQANGERRADGESGRVLQPKRQQSWKGGGTAGRINVNYSASISIILYVTLREADLFPPLDLRICLWPGSEVLISEQARPGSGLGSDPTHRLCIPELLRLRMSAQRRCLTRSSLMA